MKRKPILIMALMALFTFAFSAYAWGESLQSLTGEDVDRSLENPGSWTAMQSVLKNSGSKLEEANPVLFHYLSGVEATLAGNFAKGEDEFQRALERNAGSGNADMEMRILRRILEMDEYYDYIGSLMSHGEQLETLGKAQKDPFYTSFAYLYMAKAYFSMTEDNNVSLMLDKAMAAATNDQSAWIKGAALCLLGEIQEDYGNREKAVELYTEGLKSLNSEPQDTLINQIRYTYRGVLATNLIKLGKLPLEEAVAQMTALDGEMGKEVPRHLTGIIVEMHKGIMNTEGKDYESALRHLNKAEELNSRVQRAEEAPPNNILRHILKLKADASYGAGDFKTAADIYSAINDPSYSYSEQYSAEIEQLRKVEEKQQLDQIDLLKNLNQEREDKLKQQTTFLRITAGLLVLITAIVVALVLDYRRINDLRRKLYLESVTDHLTQLYNRGKIMNILEGEVNRSGVAAMLDIDHFKNINDTYGHLVGDRVLREISDAVAGILRSGDEIGRYGGEEFLIILKDSTLEQGVAVCERIRQTISDGVWTSEKLHISVSIGLVSTNGESVDKVLQQADDRLYQAKNSGRNQLAY